MIKFRIITNKIKFRLHRKISQENKKAETIPKLIIGMKLKNSYFRNYQCLNNPVYN